MIDLSVLKGLTPIQPPPDPLVRMQALVNLQNAQLAGQDTQSQIAERNAQARKVADAEAQSQAAHAVLADPANYGTNPDGSSTGKLSAAGLQKLDAAHPDLAQTIRKNQSETDRQTAENATNAQDAATRAGTLKETQTKNLFDQKREQAAQERQATMDAQKQAEEAAGTLIPGSEFTSPDVAGKPSRAAQFRVRQSDGTYKNETRLMGQEIAAPKAETPGIDVPFSPEVQAQKIQIAKSEKVDPTQIVQGPDENGKPAFFVVDKNTQQSKKVEGVTPKVGPSDAPAQLKAQIPAAMTTLQAIDQVRAIAKAKPQLIGPVAGRANQFAQGAGTSFGLQNPTDEQDAALMASKLGYLFANEVRAAMPGRPNPEITKRLDQVSAQMKQNPNMLEGFLKGAEQNANNAIDIGATYGIPEAVAMKAKRGGSGNIPTNPATGQPYKVGDSINGHKITAINANGPVVAQ